MMVLLSLPPALAGALSLYIGLFHLWLHAKRPRRSDLYFGLTCLAMTGYDVASALLYSAPDLVHGVLYQRWQLLMLAALAPLLLLFISEQGNVKLPSWARVVLSFFPLVGLTALVERAGWLLTDTPLIKHVHLGPYSWVIFEHSAGWLQKLLEASLPLMIIYSLWVGLGCVTRSGGNWHRQSPRSSPLVLASSVLMLGALHDIAVSRGIFLHPYLLEYAWLAVMVTMNWSMGSEVMDASKTQRTLQEMEHRVATTLSAIQDAVITCDLAGNITHMNPAAEKLLAVSLWNVLDQPLSRYAEITSPETHSVVQDPVRFAVGRPQNPYGTLPQLVTTDGNERRIDLTGSPLKDQRGHVQGAIVVMRDLTLQHNAISSLERAEKMEAMGQLAGGAAHDLNNLLTPIISYADLVQRQLEKGSRAHTFLGHVQDAALRAAELTRQLLALSRKQVLDVQVLPLSAFVQQTQPILQRLVGEDVTIQLKLADANTDVRIDPAQIEQVLLNLATNARDAMPEGRGVLTIATRQLNESEVLLEVSDNGAGMTPETTSRIFEPFFTTKPRGKGTGLGLASVRGIVEQLGGSIYVDSELGVGTSFEIILPRVAGDAVQSSVRSLPPREFLRGDEHILVAEDDPAVRTLIFDALTQLGYTVHSADGLAMALQIALTEHVDLLLTDVVLPGTDGPRIRDEILKHIEVPCLFMTGHADDRLGERGIVSRGTEVLRKPFSVTELGESVRRVIDEWRAKGPQTARTVMNTSPSPVQLSHDDETSDPEKDSTKPRQKNKGPDLMI